MKGHTIHPLDTPAATAVALCAKLDALATALRETRLMHEYGTHVCPVCDNQSDVLLWRTSNKHGAGLCPYCYSAFLL